MQHGCKVYMDSYMAPNGSCFMATLIVFKNHPLGGTPNTKPLGAHGTPNTHNSLTYSILSCVRTRMNRN